MDKSIWRHFGVSFTYDLNVRRITIKTYKNGCIKLRHDLARLLGFEYDTYVKKSSTLVGTYLATP